MFSRLLFLLMKISLRSSFTFIKLLAVGNYEKSLQKFEEGIILVHLVIRVILQELKCLCHVSEWLPCVPGGLLTLAKETGSCVASSEWMKHRQCTIPFTATKCTDNIPTDVLDIFPHAQTEPIQMAADGYKAKNPCHYDRNIRIHCADKNLTASFAQRVLNMYSNSCVGLLIVTSLYIGRTYAWDYRFVWGDVYFLVLGKVEVWNSACQEGKEFFLVGIVLKKCFPVWRNLWCHLLLFFSDLTSLLSCWILDTVRLVHIPNNVYSFTWLEMIQTEWDKDVFWAWLSKVETVVDGRAWTTAVPSKILQS